MSCILLNSTHTALIAAAIKELCQYENRTAAEVAAILAEANANAYNERYKDKVAPVVPSAAELSLAKVALFNEKITLAQILKACHSYSYQACDWSEYTNSEADRLVSRLEKAVAIKAVGFDYEEAEWTVDELPKSSTRPFTR